MNSKVLQRTVLGAVLIGGAALSALAQPQISISPPGLDVRIVTRRPPPLRYERRIPSPGRGYVYVKGFWNWDGNSWQWVPGRWDRPAVADAYWIPARYVRTSRGTIYEPGHWSNQEVVINDEVRNDRYWRRQERQRQRELERWQREHESHRDRD